MVFTRKMHAFWLFWMYFTSRITLAGFCHQTFNTQHVLNSFQEISGKYSLFRLLNPLTLLFYSVPKKLSQLLTMLLGQKKKKKTSGSEICSTDAEWIVFSMLQYYGKCFWECSSISSFYGLLPATKAKQIPKSTFRWLLPFLKKLLIWESLPFSCAHALSTGILEAGEKSLTRYTVLLYSQWERKETESKFKLSVDVGVPTFFFLNLLGILNFLTTYRNFKGWGSTWLWLSILPCYKSEVFGDSHGFHKLVSPFCLNSDKILRVMSSLLDCKFASLLLEAFLVARESLLLKVSPAKK